MRVAVAGKGGSGKTTISGTLARELARRGRSVIAVDCDTNPMLGISLGVGPQATDDLRAMRDRLESGDLDHAASMDEIIATFGTDAPDGVRLVVVSRIDRANPG